MRRSRAGSQARIICSGPTVRPSNPIVDTTLVHHGVPGLALEGDLLRLTLFPEAGAKILDLVHRPSGLDLLWKNPRVPLRRTYTGPAFDDVWCGGWDELFPTDRPARSTATASTITATSGTAPGSGRSSTTTATQATVVPAPLHGLRCPA